MKEPYRSEFIRLLREGAGNVDIHGEQEKKHFAATGPATAPWIEAEVNRVDLHQRRLNPLLEEYVGQAARILDVGCSTAGSTVAMALSEKLGAREIIGIDPNELSLHAAEIRRKGYDLPADRVHFLSCVPGQPFPVPDDFSDLTVCSSVLEYIHEVEDRQRFIQDLIRITKPGGYILLVTPSPIRLKHYHTRKFLGDWIRQKGFPWASAPWSLRRMFTPCEIIPLHRFYLQTALMRIGLTGLNLPAGLFCWLPHVATWQRILVRKPTHGTPNRR